MIRKSSNQKSSQVTPGRTIRGANPAGSKVTKQGRVSAAASLGAGRCD